MSCSNKFPDYHRGKKIGDWCCLTTFMNVWKAEFPHVIIPKNHRFSECETCAHLNDQLKAKINFVPTETSDETKHQKYKEKVGCLV